MKKHIDICIVHLQISGICSEIAHFSCELMVEIHQNTVFMSLLPIIWFCIVSSQKLISSAWTWEKSLIDMISWFYGSSQKEACKILRLNFSISCFDFPDSLPDCENSENDTSR